MSPNKFTTKIYFISNQITIYITNLFFNGFDQTQKLFRTEGIQ